MRAAVVALVLAGACASTGGKRPLPTIPPPVDVEANLPLRRPPVPVSPRAKIFPTENVGPTRCPGLPEGLLVSEVIFAQLLDAVSERDRLRAETEALRKARTQERAICLEAEQALLGRVAAVEQQLEAQQRKDAWKAGAAFVLGGLVVLLSAFAAQGAGP
jgi:hypothetical protein